LVILEVYRYGILYKNEFESIAEAACVALNELDYGSSFPHRIIKDSEVIWEYKNLNILRDELKKLAGNLYKE